MPRKSDSEVLEAPAVVYPVEGVFLSGIPATPLTSTDELAARLVRTGAFRFEAPPIPEPTEGDPTPTPLIEVIPLPDGAVAALDFYDPPEPPADPEDQAAASAEKES